MGFVSGRMSDFPLSYRQRMGRYRYEVFIERLGWDLKTPEQFECDQFDVDDAHYVIAENGQGDINGCARLLPTTRPYLLSEVFAPLLGGKPSPRGDDIWELSRFAALDLGRASCRGEQASSDSAIALLKAAMTYAQQRGVTSLVSVSPLGVERLLKRGGIRFERLAPPRVINTQSLFACRMSVQ
ncbi:acyl-homoserine-lactone synthase [Pseudomonas sp.]|uniref:acyl-homoserine-lactone synthase n=1 Tax=Pseudomonas sp. TaxID=306 RepID=UPI00299CFF73|nr:acyl-homoserine-lactone synthase [Pseudomonas sp.]MDX1368499.1 acyl-homoserine-lactone synthase [Pseudomonas sp.]